MCDKCHYHHHSASPGGRSGPLYDKSKEKWSAMHRMFGKWMLFRWQQDGGKEAGSAGHRQEDDTDFRNALRALCGQRDWKSESGRRRACPGEFIQRMRGGFLRSGNSGGCVETCRGKSWIFRGVHSCVNEEKRLSRGASESKIRNFTGQFYDRGINLHINDSSANSLTRS